MRRLQACRRGLSLVREIADLRNEKIEIFSTKDKRTRATLWIPVHLNLCPNH